MQEGIADYLEIMRLAGVSELKKATQKRGSVSPEQEWAGVSPPVSPPQERVGVSPPVGPPQERAGVSPPVSPPQQPEGLRHTAPAQRSAVFASGKAGQLQLLADEVARCTLCKELATSRTQTVFGTGNPDSRLVFLGEAPGMDEDKRGEPFVGRAGQLLTDIIVKGMRMRREDVYICNILRCRPPGNRNPMPDEAGHCRPFLDRTLEIIKPEFICCLGAVAAKNLLNSEKTIGALRGRVWDYNGIKVVCTYHPAYLLRNPAAKADTWEDIKLLLRECFVDN